MLSIGGEGGGDGVGVSDSGSCSDVFPNATRKDVGRKRDILFNPRFEIFFVRARTYEKNREPTK